MVLRVLLICTMLLFTGISSSFAWEGWVYNSDGSAFYSRTGSENTNFTWSGEIADGKLNGYGVQQFYNGNGNLGRYEGEMVDGYRQGYGVLNWGGFRYDGQWYQGYYHGHGILITASGRYEGEFRYGKKVDSE